MSRGRFFRGIGGRIRPLYRTKDNLKVRKNTKSSKASKDSFWELQLRKLRTNQKDRFLQLVEGQQDEIAATPLPSRYSGKVTVAALKGLPEHRLQRLFEITTAMMKHSSYSIMEPRDIAFGYSLMLGLGP